VCSLSNAINIHHLRGEEAADDYSNIMTENIYGIPNEKEK
jgi:hypothetical protein